jgi:hypothetical protein
LAVPLKRLVRPAREVQRAGRPIAREALSAETGALHADAGNVEPRSWGRSSLHAQLVVSRCRRVGMETLGSPKARAVEC